MLGALQKCDNHSLCRSKGPSRAYVVPFLGHERIPHVDARAKWKIASNSMISPGIRTKTWPPMHVIYEGSEGGLLSAPRAVRHGITLGRIITTSHLECRFHRSAQLSQPPLELLRNYRCPRGDSDPVRPGEEGMPLEPLEAHGAMPQSLRARTPQVSTRSPAHSPSPVGTQLASLLTRAGSRHRKSRIADRALGDTEPGTTTSESRMA